MHSSLCRCDAAVVCVCQHVTFHFHPSVLELSKMSIKRSCAAVEETLTGQLRRLATFGLTTTLTELPQKSVNCEISIYMVFFLPTEAKVSVDVVSVWAVVNESLNISGSLCLKRFF